MIVGGAVISASLSTKSLMAGFHYVEVNKTVDIQAFPTATTYNQEPPKQFYDKQLIQTGNEFQPWIWRFYYKENELQLVEV
jgi:hypothetical protein